MIVRDLLIKLGFASDTRALDSVDHKIGDMNKGISAFSIAAGNILANFAQQGMGMAVGAIKDGVDQSVKFGREMANISSLIGGDQARTKELAKSVEEMSLKFGKSTTEINEGLYDLIGTLGDSKNSTEQLGIAMKLGSAGAGTTADGLAVLTAVTKAYGDTSTQAMTEVADLASQTVNLGKITLPELAATIGQVTPLSAQLGVSMQEVAAQVATLTGVTGSGAEVMTQISSAMRAVIDRSKPMELAFKKAFKAEGIKTAKQAIGKYGFIGALDKLVKTTDGSQEQIQALFGRIEGLKLALSLTGNQADDFKDKLSAMGRVSGTVEQQYKAQTTGLGAMGFAMDKAKAQNDALARSIGDKSAPALMTLTSMGLGVKDVFANAMLPALLGTDKAFSDGASSLDTFSLALSGLQAIGIIIAEMFDVIITSLREFIALLGAAAKLLYDLSPWGDITEIPKHLAESGQEMVDIGAGFIKRTEFRGTMPDIATVAQARKTANGGVAGLAGANVQQSIGSINVSVTAAPGTEASAAAKELDTHIRATVDQMLQQAKAATAANGGAGK